MLHWNNHLCHLHISKLELFNVFPVFHFLFRFYKCLISVDIEFYDGTLPCGICRHHFLWRCFKDMFYKKGKHLHIKTQYLTWTIFTLGLAYFPRPFDTIILLKTYKMTAVWFKNVWQLHMYTNVYVNPYKMTKTRLSMNFVKLPRNFVILL